MLTVAVPAATSALASSATFQALYNASANLAAINWLIGAKSAAIAAYCQRNFGVRQLVQTERLPYAAYSAYDPLFPGIAYREPPPIVIDDAGPIVSIDSITVNGAVLVEGVDFERDGLRLFRLNNNFRVYWAVPEVLIAFTSGYFLPTDAGTPGANVQALPSDIETACLDLVNRAYQGMSRDPAATKATIFGVAAFEYAPFGASSGPSLKGGMPEDLAQVLDPYVYQNLAP